MDQLASLLHQNFDALRLLRMTNGGVVLSKMIAALCGKKGDATSAADKPPPYQQKGVILTAFPLRGRWHAQKLSKIKV